MKLRHPMLQGFAGLAGAIIIRRLVNTLDVHLDDGARELQPRDHRCERNIYAFWHESMLMAAHFRGKVHMLISNHADGELIAQVCRHLRVGTVRGSSTRGGAAGLWGLLAAAKKTHLGITPDGPRGPRRRIQPGVIFVASKTGLPIAPFGVGFGNAWRAKSWDRFAVPIPFSRVCISGGEPVRVPPDLSISGLAHYRNLAEQALLKATESAERRVMGRPRRGQVQRPLLPFAA